ncbi:SDR family NAD(P)-dependent oxidoreductase [Amycolatopsis sp. NPDC051061]|uniref:SDR family NAD(P)-dependent oxidoreductase n=1 Tax=Amycolatopsis sp. NPDC051061 TaxID=3155042 RepID=UPI0034299CE4
MRTDLAGKAVLVTGGASGIGLACAQAFQAEGARVRVIDRAPGPGVARADLGDVLDDPAFPVQQAGDVARQVLFLASPASRPVDGQALLADFGMSARSAFPA